MQTSPETSPNKSYPMIPLCASHGRAPPQISKSTEGGFVLCKGSRFAGCRAVRDPSYSHAPAWDLPLKMDLSPAIRRSLQNLYAFIDPFYTPLIANYTGH